MTLRRVLRYHWLKFLRLQEDPKQIAWGMALGVFIAFTPTIPFYLAAYKVGRFLLHRGQPLLFPETFSLKAWLGVLWQGGLALQVGGVIIAIPPAIAAYFLTLWGVQRYRRRKAKQASSDLHLSENPPASSRPEA
jgi:uncharacterized protein (DUF2062 family)